MRLSRKQSDFLSDFAVLIIFINQQPNMYCTAGELFRTAYQQRKYLEDGKSKTLKSKHLKRLAGDLNIFYHGLPIWDYEKDDQKRVLKPVRDKWNSLHEDNDCGLNWGWDFGHFQRN